jgi:hypothetical protein
MCFKPVNRERGVLAFPLDLSPFSPFPFSLSFFQRARAYVEAAERVVAVLAAARRLVQRLGPQRVRQRRRAPQHAPRSRLVCFGAPRRLSHGIRGHICARDAEKAAVFLKKTEGSLSIYLHSNAA